MGTDMIFKPFVLDYSSNLGAGILNRDNDTTLYPSAMSAITPKCSLLTKCHTPPHPLGYS